MKLIVGLGNPGKEFKIKKRIRSAGSSGQLMGWKQNEEG